MKYLLLTVFFFGFYGLQAQIVSIPNASFKNNLLNNSYNPQTYEDLIIDTNADGELQVSEALAISELGIWISGNVSLNNVTGIEAFQNLIRLEFFDANAVTITDASPIEALTNLKWLDCTEMSLPSLDLSFFSQLEVLILPACNLPLLNIAGCPLKKLDINNNPALSPVDFSQYALLEYLDISNNGYSLLNLTLLPNLEKLYCSHNQITTLNLASLPQLKELEVAFNPISPELNFSECPVLENLDCSGLGLSSLDLSALPQLRRLICTNNTLTSLDLSPQTELVNLDFSSNQLSAIDVSTNTNLQALYANNNLLTTLNLEQQPQLFNLRVVNNQITTIYARNKVPALNMYLGLITSWRVQENPLEYICTDPWIVSMMKFDIEYFGVTSCEVNSYCENVGTSDYLINLNQIHYDAENDGCTSVDPTLYSMPFQISAWNFNETFTSSLFGFSQNVAVPASDYTITPVPENPSYFNVSPSNVSISFPADVSPANPEFCFSPNGMHADLEIFALFWPFQAFAGSDTVLRIYVRNKGTETQSGTIQFSYEESTHEFISLLSDFGTTPIAAPGMVSWDFNALQPFEWKGYNLKFHLNGPTNIPAVNTGDVLDYTINVNGSMTDETPADNTFSFSEFVVNSLDPNDKTCLEGTTVSYSQVGDYVHYLIRFENTGTANAQRVIVNDVIDFFRYDYHTLVPLAAGHDFQTQIFDNRVDFIFNDINLGTEPDNNKGFITFKIKTLPTLQIGDTFSNSASIYFDYNFPVITEPAITLIQELSVAENDKSKSLTVYPNPVKDFIQIATSDQSEIKSVKIYAMSGQLLITVSNPDASGIDVSKLASGTYFVKAESTIGSFVGKLIKE